MRQPRSIVTDWQARHGLTAEQPIGEPDRLTRRGSSRGEPLADPICASLAPTAAGGLQGATGQ